MRKEENRRSVIAYLWWDKGNRIIFGIIDLVIIIGVILIWLLPRYGVS